jgi:dipeptidyl aminopeptidase/acylaminoacyl peptidase
MSNRYPRFSLLRLIIAAVLAVGGLTTHAAETDIAQLFKPAEVSHVSVSPDGQHVAMVRGSADKDTLILFKRPLAQGSIVGGVESAKGERFARITWASNAYVLVEAAAAHSQTTAKLNGAVFVLGTDGSRRRLMPRNAEALLLETAIVSVLPDEPTKVLVAAHSVCTPETCTAAEASRRRLAKVDVTSGDLSTVAEPPPIDAYFVSDPAGRTVFAAGRTDEGTAEVYRLTDGVWNRIQTFDPASDIGVVPYFVDASGRTFGLANKVGTADLVDWNTETGESTAVYRNAGSDVDGRITSSARRKLIAVRSDSGFPQWHYIDADDPFVGAHKSLRANFPESDVEVTSFTDDGTEAVVRVYSDRNAGAFYMVNTATGESTLLATSRPWLEKDALFAMEPLEVTARDGFLLRGYLTTPRSQGPHPTVVWLHDDPMSGRAERRFNPEVQLLASQGYAVLSINHRGTAGLGQAYAVPARDADARSIQRDITDATKWAIDQGIAETGQVCIAGRGYGGFAAVKALTTSGDLYRCAVAIDGYYDLSEDAFEQPRIELNPQRLFNISPTLDLADAKRAPINRASNISASVLLVGESEQTRSMESALTNLSRPVKVVTEETTLAEFEQILTYLRQHLSGAAAQVEEPISFGRSLSESQRNAFETVRSRMAEDVNNLDFGRAPSVATVRRQVSRIVSRYDEDVRGFVSEEQWQLYEAFKPQIEEDIMSDLDIVQLR